jgi:hypothetical protein
MKLLLALTLAGLALAGRADAQGLLDFVSFDGVDYIRWVDEPGRGLVRGDLGVEFATIECSMGEDRRGCSYGQDAAAAFMPAGTRMYAVRGYRTDFRLAAVWNDRIFLYQAWRNGRAKALVRLIIEGAVRTPRPHPASEPRFWVTLWLADGTTLGRPYFAETSEFLGGLAVPTAFLKVLERYLTE